MSNPSCGGRETLIFTCAGAAYSGQVSNRAGMGLAQAGAGNAFCIAAVGAEVPEKPAMISDTRRVVEHVSRNLN